MLDVSLLGWSVGTATFKVSCYAACSTHLTSVHSALEVIDNQARDESADTQLTAFTPILLFVANQYFELSGSGNVHNQNPRRKDFIHEGIDLSAGQVFTRFAHSKDSAIPTGRSKL